MPAARIGKAKGFADERYRALIERLVARRKELGLSQSALAERLGNHQQFVGRYELGERRLDVIEFVDIAKSLELDPNELLATL
jgi:transcriptional regulator with XRE-family HTH domain